MKEIKFLLIGISIFGLGCVSKYYGLAGNNSKYLVETKNDDCLDLIKKGKNYWINDSLGKNGYRLLLILKGLDKCNFVDMNFSDISEYLGAPTQVYKKEENYLRIRYKISDDSYLQIFTLNGRIKIFEIFTIDG